MKDLFSIEFGIPKHGWLPVIFKHNDFQLDFEASDSYNNPTEELYNAIRYLTEINPTKTIWCLEPIEYIFELKKTGDTIILELSVVNYTTEQVSEKKHIHTITGSRKQIIYPLLKALQQFSFLSYEKNDWPYRNDENSLEKLLADCQ